MKNKRDIRVPIKTELIENYMKEHNLSKTAFCKLCKVAPCTFKKIMEGNPYFKATALFKIARVLGIEVFEMFYE